MKAESPIKPISDSLLKEVLSYSYGFQSGNDLSERKKAVLLAKLDRNTLSAKDIYPYPELFSNKSELRKYLNPLTRYNLYPYFPHPRSRDFPNYDANKLESMPVIAAAGPGSQYYCRRPLPYQEAERAKKEMLSLFIQQILFSSFKPKKIFVLYESSAYKNFYYFVYDHDFQGNNAYHSYSISSTKFETGTPKIIEYNLEIKQKNKIKNLQVVHLAVEDGKAFELATNSSDRRKQLKVLLDHALSYKNSQESIVVHCAAGIGRTGFFILFLEIFKHYEEIFSGLDPRATLGKNAQIVHSKIQKIVENMREPHGRPLIQTERQYFAAISLAHEVYSFWYRLNLQNNNTPSQKVNREQKTMSDSKEEKFADQTNSTVSQNNTPVHNPIPTQVQEKSTTSSITVPSTTQPTIVNTTTIQLQEKQKNLTNAVSSTQPIIPIQSTTINTNNNASPSAVDSQQAISATKDIPHENNVTPDKVIRAVIEYLQGKWNSHIEYIEKNPNKVLYLRDIIQELNENICCCPLFFSLDIGIRRALKLGQMALDAAVDNTKLKTMRDKVDDIHTGKDYGIIFHRKTVSENGLDRVLKNVCELK